MTEWIKRYYLAVPVALAVLATVLSFRSGTMIVGGDIPFLEYFPLHHLTNALSIWSPLDGLGRLASVLSANLVIAAVNSVLMKVLPSILLQKLWLIALTVAPVISVDYLVRKTFKRDEHRAIISFFAGLLYVFNLYQVQQWSFGLIMYQVLYTTTPLMLGLLVQDERETRSLLWFTILVAISTIAGMNVAIFAALALNLGLFAAYEIATSDDRWGKVRFFARYAIVFFAVNSIWLTGFILSYVGNLSLALSNSLNQSITNGSIKNVAQYNTLVNTFRLQSATIYGFWLNKYDFPSLFTYAKSGFVFLGYSFLGTVITGLILGFKRTVSKRYIPFFLLLFLVGLFAVKGETPPFAGVYHWLFTHVSWFSMFRTPQNKFEITLMLPFAMLFGWGTKEILVSLKARWLQGVVFCVFVGAIIVNVFPYWQGRMFFPRNQVRMPSTYQETVDPINQQSAFSRVLVLPFAEMSWVDTNWGYEGYDPLLYMLSKPTFSKSAEYLSSYNVSADARIMAAITEESASELLTACQTYSVSTIVVHRDFNYEPQQLPNVVKNFDALQAKGASIQLIKHTTDLDTYHVSYAGLKDEVRVASNPALYYADPDQMNVEKAYQNRFDAFVFSEQNTNNLLTLQQHIRNQVFPIGGSGTSYDGAQMVFGTPASGTFDTSVVAKKSGPFSLTANGQKYTLLAKAENDNLVSLGTLNLNHGFVVPAATKTVVDSSVLNSPVVVNMLTGKSGNTQLVTPSTKDTASGQPTIAIHSSDDGTGVQFRVNNLEADGTYQFSFDYKTVSGRALAFSIEGVGYNVGGQSLNRILTQETLTASGNWKHKILTLQPGPYPDILVYFYPDLSGVNDTEELLGNFSLQSIDLPISSVLLTNQSIPTLGSAEPTTSKLSQTDYRVSGAENSKDELLLLNQAFTDQWQLAPKNAQAIHLVTNGFANAWLVPSGTSATTITFRDQHVFAASFYVAGGTILLVIAYTLRRRKP